MRLVRSIWLLYRRELRAALRERSIVVGSILIPIFLYPAILWLAFTGISFIQGQTAELGSRIAVAGLWDLPEHAELLSQLTRAERVTATAAGADRQQTIQALQSGSVDLLVELSPAVHDGRTVPHDIRAKLWFDDSKDRSRQAKQRFEQIFRRYRDDWLQHAAARLDIAEAEWQIFATDEQSVATEREMGSFVLGMILPLIIVVIIAIGSMYPAIDATAGERERSTWETSLTLATSRGSIVVAKYLYVATLASVAGLLNVAAMVISMKSVMASLMADTGLSFDFKLSPTAVAVIAAFGILLALFLAGAMMLLASFARTFREGQSLVMPLYLAAVLPGAFLQLPDQKLTLTVALIPIVNVMMVFREAINGVFRWPLIGLVLLTEVGTIALCLWAAHTVLRYEDFVMGVGEGGLLGQFLRRRLRQSHRQPESTPAKGARR